MRVIVMGCGRVGSTLAAQFAVEGHDVRVLDRQPTVRSSLPANFAGQFLVGNGFSRPLLETAGIADADAFVAVTSGDNANIVGARTAKDVYRVPQVIARIYDPRRAEIYRELGIPTVASVRWTVGQIRQFLQHPYLSAELTFGNGETLLVREPVPAYLAGRTPADLDVDGEIHAVEVTRLGRSMLAAATVRLEPGDVVTFAVAASALGRLKGFLHKELGT
jgi:trk system potassium uptake protein TrkA